MNRNICEDISPRVKLWLRTFMFLVLSIIKIIIKICTKAIGLPTCTFSSRHDPIYYKS